MRARYCTNRSAGGKFPSAELSTALRETPAPADAQVVC